MFRLFYTISNVPIFVPMIDEENILSFSFDVFFVSYNFNGVFDFGKLEVEIYFFSLIFDYRKDILFLNYNFFKYLFDEFL